MEQASCLICFHPSKNVSNIVNNNLRKVCEQLAEIKLENPPRICSLCHTRLRQAQQLFVLAQRTHLQNSNQIEEKVELVLLKQSDLVNYSVPKYYADQIKEESKDSIGPVTGTSEKPRQRKINSKSLEKQLPSPDANSEENVVLRRCLYIVDKPRKKIKNRFSQVTQNTEVDPLLTTNVPLENSNHSDLEIPLNDIISTPNINSFSLKYSLLESSNNIQSEPPKNKIMKSGNMYSCMKCAMEFRNKSNLQRHNTQSHPRKRQTYHCEFCGKKCITRHNLTSHTRVHTGEKPYECAECGGRFISKQTLARHIQVTHLKHKPYACQTCGKAFPDKAALRVHGRSHTGERPYACHCGISFIHISNFHLHFRTGAHHRRLYSVHRKQRNSGIYVPNVLNKVTKRYYRRPKSDSCTAGTTKTTPTETTPTETTPTETTPTKTIPTDTTPTVTTPTVTTPTVIKHPEERHCHFCGATYNDKWRLRSHMHVHLMFEVGQFACPICRETRTSLSHLAIHLEHHPHSDSCQTCNVTFVNANDMKLHISSFHNTVYRKATGDSGS